MLASSDCVKADSDTSPRSPNSRGKSSLGGAGETARAAFAQTWPRISEYHGIRSTDSEIRGQLHPDADDLWGRRRRAGTQTRRPMGAASVAQGARAHRGLRGPYDADLGPRRLGERRRYRVGAFPATRIAHRTRPRSHGVHGVAPIDVAAERREGSRALFPGARRGEPSGVREGGAQRAGLYLGRLRVLQPIARRPEAPATGAAGSRAQPRERRAREGRRAGRGKGCESH